LTWPLSCIPCLLLSGRITALTLAAFSHAMTSIFLLLAGFAAGLSWPWYVVWFGISVMLLVEHRLMKPQESAPREHGLFYH
jgi:hypothetical protein